VVRHDLLYVCLVELAGMGHAEGRAAKSSTAAQRMGPSMICWSRCSAGDAGWCA